MNTDEYIRMLEAKDEFHAKVMRMPGVHATSIGLKRVSGELTERIAICIHVDEKKSIADLPLGERIPESIRGFPTDVIEDERPGFHEDNSKQRPLKGGAQLAVSSRRGGPADSFGTLGCMVLDNTDQSAVALSNQHVLKSNGEYAFQPKGDVCDLIGTTKRVVLSEKVDAAIATLDDVDDSPKYETSIVGIGPVTGTFAVSVNDLPYAVKKYGRTTELTTGRITNIAYAGERPNGDPFKNQQYIDSDAPGKGFSEKGDSGSVIVDDAVRVVGLLWGGGTLTTFGVAASIDDVMAELNVQVITATDVVPRPAEIETTIRRLEAVLCRSERGVAYWQTFRAYRSEVVHLFHEIPRLHAIWRKIPQIELMDALRTGIREPQGEIPEWIGNKKTIDVLGLLHRNLVRYVDNDLREQLDSVCADLSGNIGRSWLKALS